MATSRAGEKSFLVSQEEPPATLTLQSRTQQQCGHHEPACRDQVVNSSPLPVAVRFSRWVMVSSHFKSEERG